MNALAYTNNVSEKLFMNGLCLPSGSNLKSKHLKRIEESINNYFKI